MADVGKGFLGLLDMIDGGGMGQSGSKFEGGPLSGFLNALGVRPYGYMDRLSAVRPQMRPAGLGAAAPMRPQARPAPAMSPLERLGGQPPNSSPIGAPEINPQIFNAMLLSLSPEGYMAFQRYTPEQKRMAYQAYVQSRGAPDPLAPPSYMGFGPR